MAQFQAGFLMYSLPEAANLQKQDANGSVMIHFRPEKPEGV